VRRVGNSNVVSIPRELEASGYTPGCSVLVEELPGGELRTARSTLEGALARPAPAIRNAEFALQSSVLAHGIAEGQPFLDGNQRLALVAMLTFLEANRRRVHATDPERAEWIIELAPASRRNGSPSASTST